MTKRIMLETKGYITVGQDGVTILDLFYTKEKSEIVPTDGSSITIFPKDGHVRVNLNTVEFKELKQSNTKRILTRGIAPLDTIFFDTNRDTYMEESK